MSENEEPTTNPVEIEAGKLTAEHIGKTARVTYRNGVIRSTITDRITAIRHVGRHFDQLTAAAILDNQWTVTHIHFEGMAWRKPALLGTNPDEGLKLDSDALVEVFL